MPAAILPLPVYRVDTLGRLAQVAALDLLAPLRGLEPPDGGWAPALPLPAEQAAWHAAAGAAVVFWQRVAGDARIGDSLRRLAEGQAARVVAGVRGALPPPS